MAAERLRAAGAHLGKFVGRNPVVVEVGVGSGGSLAMVTDGHAVDGGKAFVAYYDLGDEVPRLAIREVGKALGFSPSTIDRLAKSADSWYPEEALEAARAAGLGVRRTEAGYPEPSLAN